MCGPDLCTKREMVLEDGTCQECLQYESVADDEENECKNCKCII